MGDVFMASIKIHAYGHDFLCKGDKVSTCARIRHIGGGMGLATVKGDFPGTSAWRPPTC